MSGDERYLFGEVAGAVVLRDGRVAVVDGQAALIRTYSPEGEHIEDWGGSGEGPGEFSGSPERSFPIAGIDSILVEQFANDGSNIYDDRGRFGRAIRVGAVQLRPCLLGFDPSMSP